MKQPVALYRYLDGDELVYVGISDNPERRDRFHSYESVWWTPSLTRVDQWFPNRDEALVAEIAVIRSERPRENISGLPGPERDARIAARRVRRANNEQGRFRPLPPRAETVPVNLESSIVIRYRGKLALTSALAAHRYGLSVAAARGAISKLRQQGMLEPLPERINGKAELYDQVQLDKLMRTRLGSGYWPRKARAQRLGIEY